MPVPAKAKTVSTVAADWEMRLPVIRRSALPVKV